MKKTILISTLAICALMFQPQLLASSHGHSDHNMHKGHNMKSDSTQAMGTGVLHRIDVPNNMVNLTHAPMPELNWPEMTMDLPTTRRVDLSTFNEGDKVEFMLKKGRDNRFRITEMKPTN
jgi:Cu(I)/Ag(I) efflux system protein CusF